MSISYTEALRIAACFAREIARQDADQIQAAFVVGSLGSDYYRPGQSDIDTAVITRLTRAKAAQIRPRIRNIADGYWRTYAVPKGFGAIVFAEEQLYPPYIKSEELVLEILRLKLQSKLLYGA